MDIVCTGCTVSPHQYRCQDNPHSEVSSGQQPRCNKQQAEGLVRLANISM